MSPRGDEDDFPHHFERRLISDWLIHALERAGRQKEIIPLCEREAPITLSYDRLVDRLMAGRRWEEARRWCLQGIEAAPSTYPGYGAQLRQQLQTIFQRSGDPLAGLAIQAEEFFAGPSLAGFQALCEAARKSRLDKGVEAWGRHYLQTGRRPGVGRKRRSDPEMDWPLPASEVEVTADPRETEAPMTGLLIELAIAEKKPDEVLKWYDHASRKEDMSGLLWLLPRHSGSRGRQVGPSGPGDSHLEGHGGETNRPGTGEWVPGGGSLSAQDQECTHPDPSQAGMGSVPDLLETAKQPQASMSGRA